MRKACERGQLNPGAVRYYEREGLLGEVERNAGGHRIFSEEQLQTLEQIVAWREQGLRIEEIRRLMRMTPESCEALRADLVVRIEDLRRHADALEQIERELRQRRRPA